MSDLQRAVDQVYQGIEIASKTAGLHRSAGGTWVANFTEEDKERYQQAIESLSRGDLFLRDNGLHCTTPVGSEASDLSDFWHALRLTEVRR